MISALLILGFTVCLLAFQLALGSHFRRSGSLARPMRALVVLSVCVWAGGVVCLAWRGPPRLSLLIPAMVLLGAAALLFAFTRATTPARVLPAAFADEAPAFVIDRGPYRVIRHPFYTAYILYWIGFAFAAPHPAVAIGVALIIAAYVFLAGREERLLAAGALGPKYRAYMEGTGRFVPRLGKWR